MKIPQARIILAALLFATTALVQTALAQSWNPIYCHSSGLEACGSMSDMECEILLTKDAECEVCDGTTMITRACLPGEGGCPSASVDPFTCGSLWRGVCKTDNGQWWCEKKVCIGTCSLYDC